MCDSVRLLYLLTYLLQEGITSDDTGYDSDGGSMRIAIFLIERQAGVFQAWKRPGGTTMAMPLDCQLIIFTARAAAEAKRAERAAEAEVDSSHPLGPLMSCSALRLA